MGMQGCVVWPYANPVAVVLSCFQILLCNAALTTCTTCSVPPPAAPHTPPSPLSSTHAQGLKIDDASAAKMKATAAELLEERDLAHECFAAHS